MQVQIYELCDMFGFKLFAGRCRHRFSKDGSFRNRGMLDGSSKVHRIFFDWWTHGDLHGFTPGLQAWGRAAPKACFSQDRLGVERRTAGLSFLLWWAFELSDLECFWFICWFCCTSFSIKYPQTVLALLPNFFAAFTKTVIFALHAAFSRIHSGMLSRSREPGFLQKPLHQQQLCPSWRSLADD